MTTPKPGDILIFKHQCFYPLISWDDDVEAKPKDICIVIDVPEREEGEDINPNRIVLTFLHMHHEGHVNVVNWRWDWQHWTTFMKIVE